jgi:hypothetical protein
VECINQAVLGTSDHWKVAASLALFLKSEKIPVLLYVGKGPEYRPFHDFQPVPSGTDLKSRKGLMGCGSEHQSCPYKVTFQRLNIVAIVAMHLPPDK